MNKAGTKSYSLINLQWFSVLASLSPYSSLFSFHLPSFLLYTSSGDMPLFVLQGIGGLLAPCPLSISYIDCPLPKNGVTGLMVSVYTCFPLTLSQHCTCKVPLSLDRGQRFAITFPRAPQLPCPPLGIHLPRWQMTGNHMRGNSRFPY